MDSIFVLDPGALYSSFSSSHGGVSSPRVLGKCPTARSRMQVLLLVCLNTYRMVVLIGTWKLPR